MTAIQQMMLRDGLTILELSGTVNAANGTVTINIPCARNVLQILRVIVNRTVGDATNFGVEIRDSSTGTADDKNRWFYVDSGARIKYDGNPTVTQYINRVNTSLIYVLIPFSGGTAIPQTYEVTIYAVAIR